jgi:hypothetical protein
MTTILDGYNFSITIKKKVYAAMVESLENVYKHQDTIPEDAEHFPKFSLSLDDKYIYLSVSNSLLKDKIPMLEDRLIRVNQLDKTGLKEFYKQIILNGNVSQKGGAGLGIINIAKVTENKLDYSFTEIDGQHAYFTLGIRVAHYTE